MLAALVHTSTSTAHFQGISYYTHSSNQCGAGDQIKDPINVVVAGSWGDADNTSRLFNRNVTWGSDHFVDPSPQWIINHGACQSQAHQQKKGFFRGHHCRLWQSADADLQGRTDTVCDAHEEHLSAKGDCFPGNDAVYARLDQYNSGFDAGAHEVYERITNRYIGYYQRPTRAVFVQCNGARVGWDGRQLFFALNGQINP